MNTPPSPPPPSDPEPPSLTPEVVDDDEALAEAVDAFIAADPEARERLREIADLQECIRQTVDADTWRLFLQVEDGMSARLADLAVNIARWAFGARCASPPREGA